MPATIESISGIIRCGPEHPRHGDPYVWCATLRWLDPQTVEVAGVDRPPTHHQWREVMAAVRALGLRPCATSD